jgi:hypothetical protein
MDTTIELRVLLFLGANRRRGEYTTRYGNSVNDKSVRLRDRLLVSKL